MANFAFELSLSIWRGAGVCALCAFLYAVLSRRMANGIARDLAVGMVFGLAAVATMLSPAVVYDGVILDARCLLVGLAAGLGGWPAALVSAALAIPVRTSIGGSGWLAGVVGIAIASSTGLIWRRLASSRGSVSIGPKSLACLGVMVSLHFASFVLISRADAPATGSLLFLLIGPVYAVVAAGFGVLHAQQRPRLPH